MTTVSAPALSPKTGKLPKPAARDVVRHVVMLSGNAATLPSVTGRIESERRESSSARVPVVPPGKAIVFTRYEEEKSVVMNPEDFHQLATLADDLAELSLQPTPLSELALEAHRLEDTPGEPVEDPTAINALLRR